MDEEEEEEEGEEEEDEEFLDNLSELPSYRGLLLEGCCWFEEDDNEGRYLDCWLLDEEDQDVDEEEEEEDDDDDDLWG